MKWFYFEPRDKNYSNSIFVEIDNELNAKRFLTEFRKFDLYDYAKPLNYKTLDYATYFQRGCAFEYPCGIFKIYETQRLGSKYQYQTLDEYKKRSDVHFFDKVTTSKFLMQISSEKPAPTLDRCNCRHCGKSVSMAEPDGIKDDGKFSCWVCSDKIKRFGIIC